MKFLALLLCALHLSLSLAQCISGTYELQVTTLFTKANFAFAPQTAHLSPLTAFSHSRRFSAFVLYGYATPGVKLVAETGDNSVLLRELKSPLVNHVSAASSAAFAGDVFTLDVKVDCNAPFVSAVTMIAPSPDWIVAISSMDMRGPDGQFVAKREGDLMVYDAGTDSGATLTAPDKASKPVQNIAPLEGAPFNGRPAASYVLTLKGGKNMAMPRRMMPSGMGSAGKCPTAKYRLTVTNLWMKPRFSVVPDGAALSPLTAASHSRRFSALTLYGYASPGVQAIAEGGDNSVLKEELAMPGARPFVKDVVEAAGPTMPGKKTTIDIEVDCMFSIVSFLSMVAPSPDWFVAKANVETFVKGKFVRKMTGPLAVYDAGTDSGRTLMAKDSKTSPRENIAPLLGKPFGGRAVARYSLMKM